MPRLDHSRRKQARHQCPYTADVVPAIADQNLRLEPSTYAEAEDAAVAISRFDQWASRILGGGEEMRDEFAPMATVLLRSESAASSQIEHITVGARQLAHAELDGRASTNAIVVAGNVAAIRAAIGLAGRLDAASILQMHEALMRRTDPVHAGHWRTEQVWLGGSNAGPHRAAFVPPHHGKIRTAIDDLVQFIERSDIPVLPQTAIAHAQFETIHPFSDGNGRTGRALLAAMLRQKGLTRLVTVPVSAGLLSDLDSYIAALTAYRAGDPEPIVRRVTDASFAALSNSRSLVMGLAELCSGWDERLTVRSDAAARRLLLLLPAQPVLDIRFVSTALNVSSVAAGRAVEELAEAGILTQTSEGRRNRIWECPDVLSSMEAFAQRAGLQSA